MQRLDSAWCDCLLFQLGLKKLRSASPSRCRGCGNPGQPAKTKQEDLQMSESLSVLIFGAGGLSCWNAGFVAMSAAKPWSGHVFVGALWQFTHPALKRSFSITVAALALVRKFLLALSAVLRTLDKHAFLQSNCFQCVESASVCEIL